MEKRDEEEVRAPPPLVFAIILVVTAITGFLILVGTFCGGS